MRTVFWDPDREKLCLINQLVLPARLELVQVSTWEQVGEAIQNMVVRGAPAIGVAAAFGLALAGRASRAKDTRELRVDLEQAAIHLKATRPTARNLGWALDHLLGLARQQPAGTPVSDLRDLLLQEAQRMADQDVRTNQRMAEYGASLLADGDTLLHHCNTGALAAVDWGTALGAVRTAHGQGKRLHVLVDETRPRLQGARLTAWELQQYGISFEIITDGMAGYFLRSGQVDKVLFGADRIARNGDVVNKIGTYMLALAAHDNAVPVYAVAPGSTIDLGTARGDLVPIEERPEEEVLAIELKGQRVMPPGARARNPAFDVTPYRLITAIVTEFGIIAPPFRTNLGAMLTLHGQGKPAR